MNITHWLQNAQAKLESAGIDTARLDALVLLEDVTDIDRAQLLAEPEVQLSDTQIAKLNILLSQRDKHVPLAYVRGWAEFYGCKFVITQNVLEPRPESEAMIDELKRLSDLPPKPQIVDVGTGSGALGITAALELPQAVIELLEIDVKAAETAQINVDKFTLPIRVTISDLLTNMRLQPDVLLCNLPYVPDSYQINQAARHEPKIALYGGQDGLDLYRRLYDQVRKLPEQPLYILTESFPAQQDKLEGIAGLAGYKTVYKNDFILVQKRAQ